MSDINASIRFLIINFASPAPRGSITAFCREQGISVRSFHRIRKTLTEHGAHAAATPRSRARKTQPTQTPSSMRAMLIRTRSELEATGWDCGADSVADRIRALGYRPPSRITINRIFTQEHLITPQPKKRPRSSYHRFVYPAPNSCWQIDGMEHRLGDGSKIVVI